MLSQRSMNGRTGNSGRLYDRMGDLAQSLSSTGGETIHQSAFQTWGLGYGNVWEWGPKSRGNGGDYSQKDQRKQHGAATLLGDNAKCITFSQCIFFFSAHCLQSSN